MLIVEELPLAHAIPCRTSRPHMRQQGAEQPMGRTALGLQSAFEILSSRVGQRRETAWDRRGRASGPECTKQAHVVVGRVSGNAVDDATVADVRRGTASSRQAHALVTASFSPQSSLA